LPVGSARASSARRENDNTTPCGARLEQNVKRAFEFVEADAPARASSSAMDLPMPRVEPVTSATLPLSANRLDDIAGFTM